MISSKNIIVKEIFIECSSLLYRTLEGINENEFNWKPAAESRSIKEMFAHLIRVDNSFLKKINVDIEVEVPDKPDPDNVLLTINTQHKQFLDSVDKGNFEIDVDNIKTTKLGLILHAAQHYIYHYSQIVYLRRALDRNWVSPVKEWEKATYLIAEYLYSEKK